MMRRFYFLLFASLVLLQVQGQTLPTDIQMVRQGVRRFVFNDRHTIPLAALNPKEIVGFSSMYPMLHGRKDTALIAVENEQLKISSDTETETTIWFGGFNPVATYTIDWKRGAGDGTIGFVFANPEKTEQFSVLVDFKQDRVVDIRQQLTGRQGRQEKSIAINKSAVKSLKGKFIVQLLGSGLTLYWQDSGLPIPVAQTDFSEQIDLRKKEYLNTFQTSLYLYLKKGAVEINRVEATLNSGIGQADIRAITYEDGSPLLEQGRLWYTMTIRGRALPHHVQGVFSLNPTVFDLRFEGVILFDRQDGLLRNEVASHIFYDRKDRLWRGITTGFSAYASQKEKKQLLAVESVKDPRFGFSVMEARPFGIVGDIEDPHILYDTVVKKWRILTCENLNGYKAILLESDDWNKNYKRISGPVTYNSTGTSIHSIGGKWYCFSGSKDRKIFIYTYPDLKELGTLKMDLPPWDAQSGTRVWPNVIELPEGYPFKYVALMMDRFDYPGVEGPNWTYGALYLYHGYVK